MATIAEQLTQLTQDRNNLVTNLTTKGISGLTGDETFTELVPEVLNISGGTTPTGTININANGTYNVTNYASAEVSVPGETPEAEDNDVIFIDYDGKRLYSYSASEFANLSALPANPEHEGLTALGWNWSLVDAKEYIEKYGMLVIGQLYTTDDGSTRIYIELEEAKSPYLSFAVNGTATIDWGDESNTDTVTGNSLSTIKNVQHTYSNSGKYTIKITPLENSTIKIYGDDAYLYLLRTNSSSVGLGSASAQYLYTKTIKKVEIGENCQLGDYCFESCFNLETITLNEQTILTNKNFYSNYKLKALICKNNNVSNSNFGFCYNLKYISMGKNNTNITMNSNMYPNLNSLEKVNLYDNFLTGSGSYWFSGNYCMKTATIPDSITSLPQQTFSQCYSLEKINVGKNVTSIGANLFNQCFALKKVKFSSKISSLGNYAFNQCYNLEEIDFSEAEQIPTAGTSILPNIPSYCRIIVPDALYENWKTTTGWTSYASKIIKASEA